LRIWLRIKDVVKPVVTPSLLFLDHALFPAPSQVHYKSGGQRNADAFDVVLISAPIDSHELKLPDGVDAGPELEWLDEEVILIKGHLNEVSTADQLASGKSFLSG
jgi:hypothetical protein